MNSRGSRDQSRVFARFAQGNGSDGYVEGMKSRVHPTYKTRYRVANWTSYDRALVRRGDVILWLSDAIATRELTRGGTSIRHRWASPTSVRRVLTAAVGHTLPRSPSDEGIYWQNAVKHPLIVRITLKKTIVTPTTVHLYSG